MTDELTLVGCVKKKADERREARNLYTSPLFKKRRREAESRGPWAVLSAEHAFVWPSAELDPYDTHISEVDTERWRDSVVSSVVESLSRGGIRTVRIYAGSAYVEPIEPELERFGLEVITPHRGLRPGERMSKFNQRHTARQHQGLTTLADGDRDGAGSGREGSDA